MNVSENAEKLADKLASSEVIFIYTPNMYREHLQGESIPVGIYADCFRDLLKHRFGRSGYYNVLSSRDGLFPSLHNYKNSPENLLLSIDMGGLDRSLLTTVTNIIDDFSRVAVTSDEEFYKDKSFDVIQVKDEAGLRHVLFGATDLLEKKLPPVLDVPAI